MGEMKVEVVVMEEVEEEKMAEVEVEVAASMVDEHLQLRDASMMHKEQV